MVDGPLSPEIAKKLLDAGHISPATYDAIVSGAGVSLDPNLASKVTPSQESVSRIPQGETLIGPPPPPVNAQGFSLLGIPSASAPLQTPWGPAKVEPSSQSVAGVPVSQRPIGPNGLPVGVKADDRIEPLPAAQRAKVWAQDDAPKAPAPRQEAQQAAPSAPQRKNADESFYDAHGQSLERSTETGVERKAAIGREFEAYARGNEDAAKAINDAVTDQQTQAQLDEQYKARSMERARLADEHGRQRAQELLESKVDQNRYWKNLGTGEKVVTGLAMLVGGLGAGAAGSRTGNAVMDQLYKNMDRDVELQKGELQNRKDAWEMEQNIAAREFARDNDWLGFRSAKRLEGLNLMKHQADAILSKSKGEAERAKGLQAMSVIDQEIEGERMRLAEHRYKIDKSKELAAGQAAAAQSSRVEKMRAEVRALTQKLMVDRGMSYEDAFKNAYQMTTGTSLGEAARIPTEEELKARHGKKTKEEMSVEEDKRAFGVHSEYITDAAKGLIGAKGDVTAKGPLGVALTKVVPWHTDARGYQQKIDQYNAQVNTILGHWMKIEAGRVPVGEFNNIVHRFEVNPNMTDEEKAARIMGLKSWVDERAKTAGVYDGANKKTEAKSVDSVKWK